MTRMLELNTPLGEDATILVKFDGYESLGQLPEYHLEFLSSEAGIKASDLLTRNVTVGLDTGEDSILRYFNGYITSFSEAGLVLGDHLGKNVPAYLYRATMHPWLWFLTKRANCRIFQNKKVPDIIEELLHE